jgi:hypothetical protein
MIQKLESLKGQSRYSINITKLNEDSEFKLYSYEYTGYRHATMSDNMLMVEIDNKSGLILNAYIDSTTINTLPVFYFYFPLNTRWEDILMNNFCIGIKSATVEDALYCLDTISPLQSKTIYVTSKKPTNLKPYKLIRSSYREQIYSDWKLTRAIEKKIKKIRVVKEMIL